MWKARSQEGLFRFTLVACERRPASSNGVRSHDDNRARQTVHVDGLQHGGVDVGLVLHLKSVEDIKPLLSGFPKGSPLPWATRAV